MTERPYVVHGLKLSYFTGKLEAYFRTKGIAHAFVEMDTADFRRCARATGIAQMPQVECPDGRWLTDTTAIIEHFEDEGTGTAIRPSDAETAFLSVLLEDTFDEWLWRPALYYRWAFKEDMTLMSAQIARTMMRDLHLPFALKRRIILARQRRVYLRGDGVTQTTAPLVEALYFRTLAALEPIFAKRPFLMGARPCEADFGLFGPFFRHFSHDPTPAGILRETAPKTLAWVARLWALDAEALAASPPLTDAPDDLGPLLAIVCEDYLPYLGENAAAFERGSSHVEYISGGVSWRVPVSRYRVHCLNRLKTTYRELPEPVRHDVAARLDTPPSLLAADLTELDRLTGLGTRKPLNRHLS